MIDNQIPALHTSQVNIAMTVYMSRLRFHCKWISTLWPQRLPHHFKKIPSIIPRSPYAPVSAIPKPH